MKHDVHTLLEEISPGDRLQIIRTTEGQDIRYYSHYIGHIPDTSLLVTTPEARTKHPPMVKGEWLLVRLIPRGSLFTFQSSVLQVNDTPADYIHLSLPNQVFQQEFREWPRVTVSEPLKVYSQTTFSNNVSESEAKMSDISIGGALIEAPFLLGMAGNKINLKAKLTTGSFQREIDIPCIIRQIRIEEDKATAEALSKHGVEFALENDEDKLFLYSYVYEQMFYAKTRQVV